MNCRRCKIEEGVVKSRSELFCKACFTKFIKLKLRKCLMTEENESVFKVIYNDQNKVDRSQNANEDNINENDMFNAPNCKVLLPLSFGTSSLVVLHILIDYMNEQFGQHKKYGFSLEVLTLYSNEEELLQYKKMISNLRSNCKFNLNDLMSKKKIISFKLLDVNKYFLDQNTNSLVLKTDNSYTTKEIQLENSTENNKSLEESLKESFPTNKLLTSKKDILDIFKRNVILQYYNENKNFKTLLWGHSMTKIADVVISDIVKGRGSTIASFLELGVFPLYDVFLSEIDAYFILHFCDSEEASESDYSEYYAPMLDNYIPQPTLLVKRETVYLNIPKNEFTRQTKTINQFAREYFDSIEGDYSNVISTVVKTALKLDTPRLLKENADVNEASVTKCRICETACYVSGNKSAKNWLNNITEHKGHPLESDEEKKYYQQWLDEQASKNTMNSEGSDNGEDEISQEKVLCYGCLVTLHTANGKAMAWINKPEKTSELDAVLNQYTISDDDEE